jgi:predicted ribosome quality control (RQC) complex YloA/Tae2 family protein
VGRNAIDNDVLSCNPNHRDHHDWWMHVASHPGSHVVIRNKDDNFPNLYPDTLIEAALLAVVNSKVYSPQCGRIPVTLTRCHCVHKLPNTPAGQVSLSPSRLVEKVVIDVRKELHRLEALKKTLQ